MKHIKQLTIFLAAFLLLGVAYSQTYYFASPQGYGAATTGGGTPVAGNNGNIVSVSNYTDFKNALIGSKSIILVSGTITVPNGGRIAAVVKNKTILGRPSAKLVTNDDTKTGSGILELKSGSTNVIIRNLIFEGPAAYDVEGWDLLTNNGCNKLWVDHCEFRDGLDDSFDNTKKSDNITVSWCKFVHLKPARPRNTPGFTDDHRFSNLVGGGEGDFPTDGRYSITWQNCFWGQGNKDRMARARNAQLHFVSCYWNSSVAKNYISLTAGDKGTTTYCENGVFAGSNAAPIKADGSGSFNCKLVNCTKGTGTALRNSDIVLESNAANLGTISAPSYSYTKIATSQVVAAVTNSSCGAGATLGITAAGAISSSCSNARIGEIEETLENATTEENTTIYPNPFHNDFVIQTKGDFEYAIMDVSGIKMMEGVGTDKAEVGGALKSGLYLLHLKQGSKTTVLKVHKR